MWCYLRYSIQSLITVIRFCSFYKMCLEIQGALGPHELPSLFFSLHTISTLHSYNLCPRSSPLPNSKLEKYLTRSAITNTSIKHCVFPTQPDDDKNLNWKNKSGRHETYLTYERVVAELWYGCDNGGMFSKNLIEELRTWTLGVISRALRLPFKRRCKKPIRTLPVELSRSYDYCE